jgi:segregation and condensation protein A
MSGDTERSPGRVAQSPEAHDPTSTAADGNPVEAAEQEGCPELRPGPGYRVQLPAFEGPLDLLLHLIQQHELDILDIPIAFITQKYVEYITLMQQLNIDLASEYLVMAATLLHIKSKMLLPEVPEDQDDLGQELEEDPRSELVRRLLEYQKYKDAAEHLGDRNLLGREVFGRGMPVPAGEGPAPLAPVGLFKLLEAFQTIMDRAEIRMDHEVDLERFSITDRINELSDVLRTRPRVGFEELFEGYASKAGLIITFLALLEMTRLRLTRLVQDSPLAPIVVELAVLEDDNGGAAPAADDLAVTQAAAAEGAETSSAPTAPAEEALNHLPDASAKQDAADVGCSDSKPET